MNAILNAVVPLFAVIFLGYGAGRAGLFGDAGVRGLTAFVFNFAMPPLLFRMMAQADLGATGNWGFILAYLGSEVVMFGLGAAAARLLFRAGLAEMTIQGFGSAFSNGVLLTLPMLVWLYDEPGGVPALLIITLNVLTFSLVTMLLEAGTRREPALARGRILRHTVRSIVTNPIIMAAATGLLYGASGLPLPEVLDGTLAFLGRAGAPAALFALGATLSHRRIAGSLPPALLMAGAKLFVHPLLVWLLLSRLPGLDPLWLNAGVLFAASPVGLNVFIFARHYETAVETASSAILISTALSMLTITALLVLLPDVP